MIKAIMLDMFDLAFDFLIISGIYWFICWVGGFNGSWSVAIVIWVVRLVISMVLRMKRN